MVKKFVIILLVLICSCVLVIYLFNKSSTLGNLNRNVNEVSSGNSVIDFNGKEGETLKFNYSSTIKAGTVILSLTDSYGSIIETFETGISASKEIRLSKDDLYLLSAAYEDFVGSYKIEVAK